MRHVSLTIPAEAFEEVLDRLLPLVPQGVHDVPAGEGELELSVYGPEPSLAALEAAAGPALVSSYEGEAPDDPAERRARAHSRRPPIGGRIVVRPEAAPPPTNGYLDIVVEGPHGAFGAGTHPTTTMCLELLLELDPGGAFADLGSGTGVLAIVAAKLGWQPVFALDHEEVAVEATRGNALRNGVEVDALQADLLEIPPPPARTLAANLPPKVHAHVAGELPPQVERVIVSGIVDEHLPEVVAAYERAGLHLAERRELRTWAAALLVRDG